MSKSESAAGCGTTVSRRSRSARTSAVSAATSWTGPSWMSSASRASRRSAPSSRRAARVGGGGATGSGRTVATLTRDRVGRYADEAVAVRPAGRFAASADAELPIAIPQVELDGLLADPQLRRNLAVRPPLRKDAHDIAFTKAELGRPFARRVGIARQNGREIGPAGGFADEQRQLRRVDGLDGVCRGAGCTRGFDVRVVGVARQDDDRTSVAAVADPLDALETGQVRHSDVQHDRVGPKRFDRGKDLAPTRDFADDEESVGVLERALDGGQHQTVVVSEQDLQSLHVRRPPRRRIRAPPRYERTDVVSVPVADVTRDPEKG